MDGALDQRRLAVSGDDLHPGRQRGLDGANLVLDVPDDGIGVRALVHHHDATDHRALAVEVGGAVGKLRTELDAGDVFERQRYAVACRQRSVLQILERADIPRGTHHITRLSHVDHRSAGLAIGRSDRGFHLRQGDVVGKEGLRVDHHLVFLDQTADGGDLRHARNALQLILEKPVLQGGELTQVPRAAGIGQGVLINPVHPRAVRPQRRADAWRQFGLHLTEILEDKVARLIDVGAILEDDVDKGVAEHRIAAHRARARHRLQGGLQRIGHLILDDLRRLPGVGGFDDDLGGRDIGDSLQRCVEYRQDACGQQQQGTDDGQGAVLEAPLHESPNHGTLLQGPYSCRSSIRRMSAPPGWFAEYWRAVCPAWHLRWTQGQGRYCHPACAP
ncbi:hypothetical protein GALL_291300 [mine drainage metagenome]|uniref:Uncharacterized protein n=1 Tax=mine drainage metagenome TaxID=410659 RepID=A0A1J5RAE1_9ZZZZ